ncbi:MAG: pyridoxal-phosphate dependent enzyme [Candidatus Sericytochromatia bacterium]|nr:pyridoxal-phosphate dependent enzyme [Candidatus Sericytochromatia bacterium]
MHTSNTPAFSLLVPPDAAALKQVQKQISAWVHTTPVMTSEQINARVGQKIWFKCENLQKIGAFKYRGASAALSLISGEDLQRGVTTHSSGNHAQALAKAARERGIPAWIVMPENAPAVKMAAVKGYGAEIITCEATQAAREATLLEVQSRTGAVFIHPYNDYRVIAGQATAALEFLEHAPPLDSLLAPVGGGGLLSGTALACHYFSPQTRVIGCEPAGADDAFRSFQLKTRLPSESPHTMADGLLTGLGELTFEIILKYVSEIATVSEAAIVEAMHLIWERMKLVVEPSGAVPLAALLEKRIADPGEHIGIILSGGNVDLGHLPWNR